ncbi:MAG: DUF202 domain-containing protein, partial [Phycisphaerales bacterium]|nr:DUF202 domain-containing protein [Phycisphaerales bacterium]
TATRDHLANERTYLAWIRTSITVVGLGFVVGKFGVWLRFLSSTSNEPQPPKTGYSVPLAIAMVVVGALLALLGAWRYRMVRQAIEQGRTATAGGTVAIVTVIVVAFALAILAVIARSAA